MVMVGAFLGGPDTTLPVGKAGISLCVNTTDRLNLSTASFVVTATGFSQTVQADASGRAYIEVPAGKTYTVTLNHDGNYENDGPQTVVAESRVNYGVFFDLFDYPSVSTVTYVSVTYLGSGYAGVAVNAVKDGLTITGTTGSDGVATLRGLDVGTWTISLPEYGVSETLAVDELIENVALSIPSITVSITGHSDTISISGPSSDSKVVPAKGSVVFGPLASGTYTVSGTYDSKTVLVDGAESVEIETPMIFGVKVAIATDDPVSRCTYIEDNASWPKGTRSSVGNWLNGKTPFSDVRPVLKSGNTWTNLNKRDLTKSESGASVDITTLGNDVLVEIPTWWYSTTTDGTYDYFRWSNVKVDSSYKKVASLWNGADVGMAHVGAFHAYNDGSKTYSSKGRSPTVNVSTESFRATCQARGTGYDKMMWHHHNYIAGLVLLFFGTTNPQTILRGYVDASSKDAESITSFDNDLGISGSFSHGHMTFLWINDLWGNVYTFIGGAKTDSSCRLMTLDNGEPDNTTGTDYVTHPTTPTSSRSGYISDMDCQSTEVGLFPKTCSGSSTTRWADYGYVYASFFPYVGGAWNNGGSAGPFSAIFDVSASGAYSGISSRLSYRAGRPQ